MSKIKLILCGYDWVGYRILQDLINHSEISDLAVYSHKNTSLRNIKSMKEVAKKNGIYYTENSINSMELPFVPDVISVVYYRHLINKNVIKKCNNRIFNLHPSLLPIHRGCSSITWAMLEGDSHSGITYHYIDNNIDTGNIILQAATQIYKNDTQLKLYHRCMLLGYKYWNAAFQLVINGFSGVKQIGKSSYHFRGAPYNGEINESWPFDKIERFIRAMNHPPYPYATYRGKEVRNISDFIRIRDRL